MSLSFLFIAFAATGAVFAIDNGEPSNSSIIASFLCLQEWGLGLQWAGTHGAHLEGDLQLTNRYVSCYYWACRCGRDYCDAKELMSVADAMATNGMKDAGYEYINIAGKFIIQKCK